MRRGPVSLLLLALATTGAAQDFVFHQGAGFTIAYPKKDSRLQPASATVPFQLVYRKNSLLRLETERLTQPIDLSDDSFSEIFLEVQRERLLERIRVPIESQQVKRFAWGTGIEFVYHLPARSGKRKERDLVTEVVTTVEKTLYRFTYWIPEKDLKRVAAPFAQLVESFRPEGAAQATAAGRPSGAAEQPVHATGRYSVQQTEERVRDYREEISDGARGEAALSDLQAALAEELGWKAYLSDAASPAEVAEMRRAADAAVKAAPSDVDAHQARAWAAYHENRMVEMEEEIKAALQIEPDNAENHLLYALWYGFSPERSEAMAREALEDDPELAPAYYVKARADRRAGDLVEARNSLEQAVRIDPGFVEARLELAEVLKESGDSEAALDACRAAVAAAPDHVGARFQYAVALRRAGRIDEAMAEYGHALRLDANLSEAHYNLAVLYLQEKRQPDKAAEHFRRFIELDPDSDRAPRVLEWLSAQGSR